MSFLSDLSRKLGFTSGEDDREEELEDSELPEDEEEEDYAEEDEDERGSFHIPNPFRSRAPQKGRVSRQQDEEEEPEAPSSSRRGNVIYDSRMESRSGQGTHASSPYTHCERIIDVRQIDDCRNIIKFLLDGESVLLNLENIEPKDCTRVVDLLSGAAFALQGRLVKIAHLSYLLAPQNVEVVDATPTAGDRARYR